MTISETPEILDLRLCLQNLILNIDVSTINQSKRSQEQWGKLKIRAQDALMAYEKAQQRPAESRVAFAYPAIAETQSQAIARCQYCDEPIGAWGAFFVIRECVAHTPCAMENANH